MQESGGSLRGNLGTANEHQTWVERQLGDGWTEVEPGIYRFAPDRRFETELPSTSFADPPTEEPIDPLEPTIGESEAAGRAGRGFVRRLRQ